MSFDELVKEFHEFASDDPVAATWLGLEGKDHLMPDPGMDKVDSDVSVAKELLKKVKSSSRENLNFEQIQDLDLMILYLGDFIFLNTYKFNGYTGHQQLPDGAEVVGSSINYLFVKDHRASDVRLGFILERMKKIPAYLDASFKRLTVPVKRWVNIDVDDAKGLLHLFGSIYAWAKSESYGKIEELADAKKSAENAVKIYIENLKQIKTTNKFAIGEDLTRMLIKLRGIDKSIEELHEMAKNFFKENNEIVQKLKSALAIKYSIKEGATPEEVVKVIKKKFHIASGRVIPYYREVQERVNKFIGESGLFYLPANEKLIIEQTPKFLESSIPVGAMFPPAPFAKGPKTSLVYLTVTEDRLADQNKLSITNTMIHEGKPGHHLHYATAYENPSIVRKHLGAIDQAEGWTTYMEDYMIDQGFIEKEMEDEIRFIGKMELARLGARVAIDLFFMTGDDKYLDIGAPIKIPDEDPFAKAASLLRYATGFTEGRLQSELNWHSQLRGTPLSYLTGNVLLNELKGAMMKKVGNKMPEKEFDRKFHDTYLKAGAMPLSFARSVFENKGLI